MKTTMILGIVAIAVIAGISVYAVSPYFTNTTINEVLPESISSTSTESLNSMSQDDTTMEKTKPPAMSYEGNFMGVNDGIHNAEGVAKVISLEDGSSILRLEDFESTNGPDLYVYLSTDEMASDFVSLGKLKANAGNQNYQLPENIDLSKHNKVLIWCQAFGVLFGSAELQMT